MVRDAITRNGGTPVIEGDTAHFFVETPEGHSTSAWTPYINDVLIHILPRRRRAELMPS